MITRRLLGTALHHPRSLCSPIHVPQRHSRTGSHRRTCFKLRCKRLRCSLPPATLTQHRPPDRLDRHRLTLPHRPLQLQSPHPQSSSFRKQDLLQPRHRPRPAQTTDNYSRPPLLHLHRNYPHVQRASRRQPLAYKTHRLTRHVIQCRFQQCDRFGLHVRRSRSNENSQHIRPLWKCHRPATAPNRLNRHRRQRSKSIRQHLHDRGTGRSRQFGINRHHGQWNALQNLRGPRSRHGADSMINPDIPPPRRHRIADQPVDLQQIKRHSSPHNVHNRINRPDLVKMDRLHRYTMHPRLGFGNHLKHLQRQRFLPRRQH